MASKKEHKRKQKNKGLGKDSGGENPFLQSGVEINSLDLLSSIYSVPKATEGGGDASKAEATAKDAPPSAKEEQERRLREEEAERKRIEKEEEERTRREAEAAAKAKREAEEAAERKRVEEEEARRRADEERQRQEAEAAAKAKREAEEAAERKRVEEEEARRRADEERQRQEAEAAAKAKREAEEAAERKRAEEEANRRAEADRKWREAEAAAKAKREAEKAAEQARREEEAAALARKAEAERQRAEEEALRLRREGERLQRETEEAERKRREEEAAERARKMAAEAERARLMAEQVERARLEAEEAERRHRAEAEADRLRQERDAAERAAKMAEKTARMRQMADTVARNRRDELSPSAAADAALERELPASKVPAEAIAPVPSAPPLEVDNPYWQKPPEIFDVLSGAPHGVGRGGRPDYVSSGDEPSLPVTMAESGEGHVAAPPGSYVMDYADSDADPDATVAVPLEKRMYIVMVTPEVAPCAKVGGLGDVILGLGRELMRRGHGVEVICPMYSSMRYDLIEDLHEEYGELWCPHYDEWRAEKVYQGRVGGGLQVNFISGGGYTDRPSIYGFDDDLQRFTYFSRQALEFMYKTNRRPDIIHCHDWATGLVPPMLWDIYEKLGWNNSRVVYTIHNNECQGLCGFGDKLLSMVGMDAKQYMRPDRMQDDTHKNCINMMKGGIVYSNFVTTVSPTYAGELKTASGGRGLQTTIAKNSAKVGGVLNGIDYDTWNPGTDDKLSARYSGGDDFFEKYKNKTALREWLGMWDAWRPIISVVTRLTHQKGLDLIKHAIYSASKLQAQFVLLGSAPDPKVNDDFLRMQHELRDNHDINLYIGYHEDLSHLIYAGSDMFLVPSLYEPCGLTQMISLRYGTVPIVRETGGLVDTVFDLDNSGRGLSEANGFTFRDANPVSLDYGLERAVRLWYDNPEAFNRLARNGMRYDYSWKNPAEHYENIYNYIKA